MVHVIKSPNGRFLPVGQVPTCLLKARKPTHEDVMAGRVLNGVAYVDRGFESLGDLLVIAIQNDVEMCNDPGCACRNLFSDHSQQAVWLTTPHG